MQALPQWPNTVSVGTRPAPAVGPHQTPRGSRVGRAVAAVRQRTLGTQPQLGDYVQALWAAYKPLTKPDLLLLDRSACCLLLADGHLGGWNCLGELLIQFTFDLHSSTQN